MYEREGALAVERVKFSPDNNRKSTRHPIHSSQQVFKPDYQRTPRGTVIFVLDTMSKYGTVAFDTSMSSK